MKKNNKWDDIAFKLVNNIVKQASKLSDEDLKKLKNIERYATKTNCWFLTYRMRTGLSFIARHILKTRADLAKEENT